MHAKRAKLFMNGGSQAVRLPRDCRFEGTGEVQVRKAGRSVILEPVSDWSPRFLRALGAWRGAISRPRRASLRDPFAR